MGIAVGLAAGNAERPVQPAAETVRQRVQALSRAAVQAFAVCDDVWRRRSCQGRAQFNNAAHAIGRSSAVCFLYVVCVHVLVASVLFVQSNAVVCVCFAALRSAMTSGGEGGARAEHETASSPRKGRSSAVFFLCCLWLVCNECVSFCVVSVSWCSLT